MALKALKCPNCNANIQVDDDRDYGFCSYCGAQVQVREVVEIRHSGTIKTEVEAQFDQLMENGYAYLKMQDYYRAEMEFLESIHEYPGRSGGYEGLIRTITREYTVFLVENQERVYKLMDKMLVVAKEEEKMYYAELRKKVEQSFDEAAIQNELQKNRDQIAKLSKIMKENIAIAIGSFLFAFFLFDHAEKNWFIIQLGFLCCFFSVFAVFVYVKSKKKREELMEEDAQLEAFKDHEITKENP